MNAETLGSIMLSDTDNVMVYLQKIRLIVQCAGEEISYKEAAGMIDRQQIKWEAKKIEKGIK